MGPWWWWWAGRFTLSLAFVFLFCSFSLAESLLVHRSTGCKQPRVTTHLTHTRTSFSMSAADRWKTLLTALLTTIATHLCMIYISICDPHALMVAWNVSKTVRWRKLASNICSDFLFTYCLIVPYLIHNCAISGLSFIQHLILERFGFFC